MLFGSAKKLLGLSQLSSMQQQSNYMHHLKRMLQIQSQQINIKKVQKQQNKIAKILRKSKQASKSFKRIEQLTKRRKQDRKMVNVLIDIKRPPKLNTEWARAQSYHNLKSASSLRKHRDLDSQVIPNHSRELVIKIINKSVNAVKYPHKLKQKIQNSNEKSSPFQKPIVALESKLPINHAQNSKLNAGFNDNHRNRISITIPQ